MPSTPPLQGSTAGTEGKGPGMTAGELIEQLSSFPATHPVILIVGDGDTGSFTVSLDDFGQGPCVVLEGDRDE